MDFQKHAKRIESETRKIHDIMGPKADNIKMSTPAKICAPIDAAADLARTLAKATTFIAKHGGDERFPPDAQASAYTAMLRCGAFVLWVLAVLDVDDYETPDPRKQMESDGFDEAAPGVLYTADGGEA